MNVVYMRARLLITVLYRKISFLSAKYSVAHPSQPYRKQVILYYYLPHLRPSPITYSA